MTIMSIAELVEVVLKYMSVSAIGKLSRASKQLNHICMAKFRGLLIRKCQHLVYLEHVDVLPYFLIPTIKVGNEGRDNI